MYAVLNEGLNRIFVDHLRSFWTTHPKYRDDLVDNIQGRYSFSTRPQRGIVVKVGGGNQVFLAADNFQGTRESYVFKMQDGHFPGLSVEWLKEDAVAIRSNGGVFPSAPGLYYIEITQEPSIGTAAELIFGEFRVGPLLDVRHEVVSMVDPSNGLLSRPFLPGSLRLYESPSGSLLFEPENYTSDPATGEIFLNEPLPAGLFLSADYRYPGEITEGHQYRANYANHTAIPGVVLVFGNRSEVGDRLVIVVQSRRSSTDLEFGGRWSLSVDLDIFARDVHDVREIHDHTVMFLASSLRSRLSTFGIEIGEVSLGGESEEIYDDNADDYFFNASVSVPVETDWLTRVPLPIILRQAMPVTVEEARRIAGLPPEVLHEVETNLRMLDQFGLRSFRDPFFQVGRGTYEMIR